MLRRTKALESGISAEDFIATLTELTAVSIAKGYLVPLNKNEKLHNLVKNGMTTALRYGIGKQSALLCTQA